MSHLIYKKPLMDKEARDKYVQSRRELSQQKKEGLLDPVTYKVAKEGLMPIVAPEQVEKYESGRDRESGGSTPLLNRSGSVSSGGSRGSRTDRSSSVPSVDSLGRPTSPSARAYGLTRTMTEASTTSNRSFAKRVLDRNEIGKVAYRPSAYIEIERELLRKQSEERKKLKRLMGQYETSHRPITDKDIQSRKSHTSAGPQSFYATEPLAPVSTSSSGSSKPAPAQKKKSNFGFLKWGGSNKSSPVSPEEPTAVIDIVPRNLPNLYLPNPALSADRRLAPSESLPPSRSQITRATDATANRSAPFAGYRTPTFSSTTRWDTVDARQGLGSSITPDHTPHPPHSLADYFLIGSSATAAADRRRGSNVHYLQQAPLLHQPPNPSADRPGSSASNHSAHHRRRHSVSSDLSFSPRPSESLDRPMPASKLRTAKASGAGNVSTSEGTSNTGSSLALLYRAPGVPMAKHAEVAELEAPLGRLTTQKSRFGSMSALRQPSPVAGQPSRSSPPNSSLPHQSLEKQLLPRPPPPSQPLPPQPSPLGTSPPLPPVPVRNRCQSSPVPEPSKTSGSPGMTRISSPASSGRSQQAQVSPSSVLLDAFMALIEEYTQTTKLFSFTKSREKPAEIGSRKSSLSSFQTAATGAGNCQNTIKEDDEAADACYANSITDSISTMMLDDADIDDLQFYFGGTIAEAEEYLQAKEGLENVAWFLMASKWLSFGRLLFSPGHHLLQLGKGDELTLGLNAVGVDEARILDMDGMTIGWSWHLACEYPNALVFNTTTDPLVHATYGKKLLHPPNHRLVRTYSHIDLHPLESNFFDVITARALPRRLQRNEWIPLLKECHRVLKADGYLEITVVDPVLNNMGPVTKQWIHENIIQPTQELSSLSPSPGFSSSTYYSEQFSAGGFDPRPTKSILSNLDTAGFKNIHKCWVWMPAASIGDELSMVTSKVGKYFYDELFADWGMVAEQERRWDGDYDGSIGRHKELVGLWGNPEVQEECLKENTAFRWLKCHARKQ